ncbi:hypothetical protein Raf01_72210 [Rugosimonospora africana]|uniref:Uncharacterized protein n=1 Tax=Rugosimonospora africana TaxID=556532 RepID=A0A8J3QZE9_9ACTN|nr:hypothetical protein Raf01_72210 [Rugosimonospora africana]
MAAQSQRGVDVYRVPVRPAGRVEGGGEQLKAAVEQHRNVYLRLRPSRLLGRTDQTPVRALSPHCRPPVDLVVATL